MVLDKLLTNLIEKYNSVEMLNKTYNQQTVLKKILSVGFLRDNIFLNFLTLTLDSKNSPSSLLSQFKLLELILLNKIFYN